MTHKGTVRLETEQLILRHFTPDDAEAMFRNIASDPDVVRFMLYERCDTEEATRKHIEQWLRYFDEPGARELFAIELKDTGELIGTIDYAELDIEARSAEVGYQLGKAWWGRGYTAEALRAVLAHCFESVGLNRVWADHDMRNRSSGRVMQKAGMLYEGTFRQCKTRRGELIDKAQYAILAEDCFAKTVRKDVNPIQLGVYRHYKGNRYEVIGFAKHSETLEDMVIYKALYGEQGTWVRPLSMWSNVIDVDGKTIKRFELIAEEKV